jgi:hypothetical protein
MKRTVILSILLALAIAAACINEYMIQSLKHKKMEEKKEIAQVPAKTITVANISPKPFSVIAGGQAVSLDNPTSTDLKKLLGGPIEETEEEKQGTADLVWRGVAKTIIYKGMKLYVSKGARDAGWGVWKIEVDSSDIKLTSGIGVGDSLDKLQKIYPPMTETGESQNRMGIHIIKKVDGEGTGNYEYTELTEGGEETAIFTISGHMITNMKIYYLWN